MLVKPNMTLGMKKNLRNMTKKRIGLYLLLDEILEKKTEPEYIKHTKKTISYLTTILYMDLIPVHTIKMIKSLIGILW